MKIDIQGCMKRVKPGHYIYTNYAQEVFLVDREGKNEEMFWRVTHDYGPWIGAVTFEDYFKTLEEVEQFLEDQYYKVYVKVEKPKKKKKKKKKK
jgi:hypothetical protein